MPKVSIVIAAFNCADYINETVESALSQTFQDYEIIIVDDYSTDGTRAILQNFKNPKIRTLLLKENLGPSGARNEGILSAEGEYIAILDHDDKWFPDKLEKQLELFKKDKDLGLAYCDCLLIDKTGKPIGGSKSRLFDFASPRRGYVFNDLIVSNFIPTSAVIFRREVVEKAGLYDRKYFICQDFDYYLRISKIYKIDYLDEVLVMHRWFTGARTRYLETTLKESIAVTKEHLGMSRMPFRQALTARRAIAGYYKALLLFYLKKVFS